MNGRKQQISSPHDLQGGQATGYDASVGQDIIIEPKCPAEKFVDSVGEEKAVRNSEYYKLFCAWMQEIQSPTGVWESGHFVDSATKAFAKQQFEPDSTCMKEIFVAGKAATGERAEYAEGVKEDCRRADEVCRSSYSPERFFPKRHFFESRITVRLRSRRSALFLCVNDVGSLCEFIGDEQRDLSVGLFCGEVGRV